MPFFINLRDRSRNKYSLSKYIEYAGDMYDILNSSFIEELDGLGDVGVTKVTTQEYRPDLLSLDIYGTTQLWWVLMAFNDIISNDDLVLGTTIRYPSLGALERVYFSLVAREQGRDRRGV